MKIIATILLSIFFTTPQPKKKVIFFGDSIIELAVKPGGFVLQLDSLFKKGEPTNFELIGSGISANKIYDLYLRLDEDVLKKNPDAVIIWIGVNDVWHKRLLGTGTDAEKFERFYNAVLKKLKERDISIILCTPAVIGERWDHTNEQDGDLNKYATIIRNIAAKNKCVLVDFRKIFLEYNKLYNPDNKDRGILTYDGVHLNKAGHDLVTNEFYKLLTSLTLK